MDFGNSGDLKEAHKKWKGFRFVHSLWTDCAGSSIDTCKNVVPYRRPGNMAASANRYTFLLVCHSPPIWLLGKPLGEPELDAKTLSSMTDFSLPRLIEENPDLSLLGKTYMSINMD